MTSSKLDGSPRNPGHSRQTSSISLGSKGSGILILFSQLCFKTSIDAGQMPNSPKLLNILCYVAPRHLFFQDINLNVVIVLYLFILFIFIDINVKLAPTKLHLLETQQWNTTFTSSLFKDLFRIQPTSLNPNPAFVLSLTRLSVITC